METSNSQNGDLENQSRPVERTISADMPVYGSTNTEVVRVGDINADEDEPPLSFADLGIPTGPKLESSPSGKRRRLQDIEKKEIAFLIITGLGIVALMGFTVEKAATVDKSSPDFIFALILIANTAFCAFYLVNGVLKERPYEIFILVSATIINTLYIIVNFILSVRGTVKLVRLITACAIGPAVVVLGLLIGREYLVSGNLVFRTVGANSNLQSMCRTMYMFLDLLKLDLQLGMTMVILIMTDVNDADIAILVVGIFITIVWFVLGHLAVRFESKPITIVFWALSPVEIAYIIYKAVKASERLEIAKAVAAVSLTAGILAVVARVGVIVLTFFVFRNFGYGLKEKAFGSPA